MMNDNRFSEQLELAARQLTAEREYWLRELSDITGGYGFPANFVDRSGDSSPGEIVFTVPDPALGQLKKMSKGSPNALHVLLTAALGVLLSRYLDVDDVLVGTTIYRQGSSNEKQFSNLCIPVKMAGISAMTVKQLLNGAKAAVKEAMSNYRYPIEILTRDILGATAGSEPSEKLFDVGVIIEDIQDKDDLAKYRPNVLFLFRSDAGAIECRIEYNSRRYQEDSVELLKGRLLTLLHELFINPGALVDDIGFMDEMERKQALDTFNNTSKEFNREITIHEWFDQTAGRNPDSLAVAGNIDGTALTFGRLKDLSRRLALKLRHLGVTRGSIVAIMAEPSHYLAIGILAVLKAGAAYMPVDPLFPVSRWSYMMADSRADLLLTAGKILQEAGEENQQTVPLDHDSSYDEDEGTLEGDYHQQDLLYVIYTSGTTGKPKGVQLEHKNLVNYVTWLTHFAGICAADKSILVSSFAFDLGYTALYPSLLNGGSIHILSRDDYMEPDFLLDYVARHNITYLKMTPSMFNVLAQSPDFSPSTCSSLRLVVLGGEAIVVKDVETAHEVCPHIRFMNHYGPTEATIGCIARFIDFDDIDDYRRRPTIGKPIANTRVYILDKRLNFRPAGLPGELCIAGDGLARGYLNRPETTGEKFLEDEVIQGQRVYRTGDSARFTADGMVEFLGRVDHQVKIRGYRIELGEIESRLAAHPMVGDIVVVVRGDEPSDKHIVAYVVPKGEDGGEGTLKQELTDYLSASLPSYMIPAFFVFMEQLPLNANGKVDRRALPQPKVEAGQDYQAPTDETEEALVTLWSDVLEIDASVIGTQANFFSLGGQSLKATVLAASIHREFFVRVPLTDIFQHPTVAALAQCIRSAQTESYAAVLPTEQKEYYNLSSAQTRLFVLQHMEPDGTVYNRPKVSLLNQAFPLQRFEAAARKLVTRHETLRTSFLPMGEIPVQRVHDDVPVEIQSFDLTSSSSQEETRERIGAAMGAFIKPFDLSTPPLFRIGLAALPEDRFALMTDMHHIICDGVSQGVMERDFTALLHDESLETLEVQYRDFSEWQNREKASGSLAAQEEFWLSQFSDTIPVLNLPEDFSRPPVQSFDGDVSRFQLDKRQSEAIRELALEHEATHFMVLLALFYVLLGKLSGQEDIVTGIPIAGRRHPELQNLIGMFVNTLVLRGAPEGGKPFIDLLREVKVLTVKAFENQDYQFEDLVERLVKERDSSRHPVFDCMFAMIGQEGSENKSQRSVDEQEPRSGRFAKFDLTLSAGRSGGEFYFSFEYCTRLFTKETVKRFADYFIRITQAVLDDPAQTISAISLISDEERKQILEEFNNRTAPLPKEALIHRLFQKQAEQTPDAVSLVYRDSQVSYRQLDLDSSGMAAVLCEKGVGPDEIVGIGGDRGVEMITGILSILKAGGTYLPLSTGLPHERICYMMRDCNARLLISTNPENTNSYAIDDVETIIVPQAGQTEQPLFTPKHSIHPGNLAYVIYTSGSTGKAKGVLVHHEGLVNTISWFNDRFDISVGDRVLQITNISFDVSVEEIFSALTCGAALVVFGDLTLFSKEQFLGMMRSYCLTIAQFVPLVMSEYLGTDHKIDSLRVLICGGDRLDYGLKERMTVLGYDLHNHYGPTETSIDALASECGAGPVVIGKPVANTSAYIMSGGHLLPIGLVGELCLAGAGVARGYLNNPEATNAAFVPDPFSTDGRLYKTGDFARLQPDGNVEFLGRIDQQVKIRGFRIELGEIESWILQLPGIQNAAVVAREYDNGEKYLCGYVVTVGGFDEDDVRGSLGRQLPAYMVPSYFVELDMFPLTPSGKIDRKALPAPLTADTSEPTELADAVEERLALIWADILGLDYNSIGSSSDFFRLGGHSLRATVLVGRLHREFNCEIPLSEIFQNPTIKGLADVVRYASRKTFLAIPPSEKKDFYPLSPAQKRLYIMQSMDPTSTAYNIPHVSAIGDDVDQETLCVAFYRLIERHDSLRTGFSTLDSVPVQRIYQDVDFDIEWLDTPAADENPSFINEVVRNFVRPFDLSQPPLFRAGLMPTSSGRKFLVVDLHHIVSDGASMEVLLEDFHSFMKGDRLAPLSLQYVDYSEWQAADARREKINELESFWISVLGDKPPALELPLDFPRPEVQAFAGKRLLYLMSEEQSLMVARIASEEGATVFMVMLAVFYIFLSRVSGQEDMCVGTPTSGRPHPDLERIVGMFVNTLVLRNNLVSTQSFVDFLETVRHRTIEAFENQDLQFEDIVEKIGGVRDSGRNPIFDVMFEYSRVSSDFISQEDNEDLNHQANAASKFDLILNVLQYDNRILIGFTYNKKIFEIDTIRRFSRYYQEILEQVTDDRHLEIKDINISLELCDDAVELPDMDFDF